VDQLSAPETTLCLPRFDASEKAKKDSERSKKKKSDKVTEKDGTVYEAGGRKKH